MNTNLPASNQVPDIGDIVEYGLDGFGVGPATYRVSSWLKPHVVPARITGHDMRLAGAMWPELDVDQRIEAIVHSFDDDYKPRGTRLVWCLRDEATHLSMSGICGAVGLIEKCKVVGRVAWTDAHIAESVASAERRAGMLSDVYV